MRRLARVVLLLAVLLGAARPALAQEGAQLVVRQLKFVGNKSIQTETLKASIATTVSSFFATNPLFRWMGLGEKRYLNETDFQRDVLRLQVLYKRSGFPDVQVDTTVRRTAQDAYITFRITEGEPVRVARIEWTGLDSLPPLARKDLLVDLPLREGDPFNRFLLQASIDTVTGRLRDRGYPSVDIFRSFTSDTKTRRASVRLDVVPGRRAVIGAVRVEGSTRVDSSLARKLLVTRPGRLFRASELTESQRNLYTSDLYAIASVSIDSAKFQPGSDSVPLVVRVNDARPYRVQAGLGYGTTDCFRGSSSLTARNFLGGGRVLALTGSVSKVGVGTPFNAGLQRNVCRALLEDSIGSRVLNYNVGVSLRRPAFLSPRNTITTSIYSERVSEFKVYLRDEQGVRVTVTRETPRRRLPLSLSYNLASGRTNATPAVFCAFFSSCTPELVTLQQQRRRLALLSASVTIPRSNSPVDPTRGYVASFEATTSSRFLLSSRQQEFTRFIADGAWYRPLGKSTVLSWHLRGGVILAPSFRLTATDTTFVPLDQRFYAGGPNDVRGYQQNELGPVVYVLAQTTLDTFGGVLSSVPTDRFRVAATGGNTLAVGNVEVRVPTPFFAGRLRFAVFVDAGTMWERGALGSRAAIRVTPGVGLRFTTPLGPARFDIAYNPYKLQPGPLFLTDTLGALTAVPGQEGFVLDRRRNFTVHFSVGQPF